MAAQNKLLRTMAKGDMKAFVKAIGKDAAMIEFLDTVRNEKAIPNENYPRELMELFTLGVFDSAGNANYTQADIVQIARAFTGWRYSRTLKPYLDEGQHDFNSEFSAERGPKRIFESTGQIPGGADFDANGEGEPEIDTVVDIIFSHRDTDGKNTVARRTARRLLEFYVGPDPDLGTIDAVVAQSGFDTTFNIQALVRAIFCDDAFYATGAAVRGGRHQVGQVAGRLRDRLDAPARHEVRGQHQVHPRRQLFRHPHPHGEHGADPPRSAERLRLGLGDQLAVELDLARALQLRARHRRVARRRSLPAGQAARLLAHRSRRRSSTRCSMPSTWGTTSAPATVRSASTT